MSFTSSPNWNTPYIQLEFINDSFYSFTCRYAYKDYESFHSYLNSLPCNDLMEAWESGYNLFDLIILDPFSDL